MVLITVKDVKINISAKEYLYFLAIKQNPGVKFTEFRSEFNELLIHQSEIYKYMDRLWQLGIIEIRGEDKELYVSSIISPKEGALFISKLGKEDQVLDPNQKTLFDVKDEVLG